MICAGYCGGFRLIDAFVDLVGNEGSTCSHRLWRKCCYVCGWVSLRLIVCLFCFVWLLICLICCCVYPENLNCVVANVLVDTVPPTSVSARMYIVSFNTNGQHIDGTLVSIHINFHSRSVSFQVIYMYMSRSRFVAIVMHCWPKFHDMLCAHQSINQSISIDLILLRRCIWLSRPHSTTIKGMLHGLDRVWEIIAR